MHIRHGRARACALVAALLTSVAGPAFAQEAPPDAFAQQYAADFGVSLDEAKRRLALSAKVADLQARLAAQEGSTFAGLIIQHRPSYKVQVRFTGDANAALRRNLSDPDLLAVTEAISVPRALAALQDTQVTTQRAVEALGVEAESDIDVATGRIKIYVANAAPVRTALTTGAVRFADYVDLVEVPRVNQRDADALGGEANQDVNNADWCTNGFAVKGPAGDGVTTAGHCVRSSSGTPITVRYKGVAMTVSGVRYDANYDTAYLTGPGLVARNLVKMGLYNHTITGTRAYASQPIGEYVCINGRLTSYKCGTITSRNVLYTGQTRPWMRVEHAQNSQLRQGGDSGGPWYYSGIAFGTHVGPGAGDPNDAVYMPIDYVGVMSGVTIFTGP